MSNNEGVVKIGSQHSFRSIQTFRVVQGLHKSIVEHNVFTY